MSKNALVIIIFLTSGTAQQKSISLQEKVSFLSLTLMTNVNIHAGLLRENDSDNTEER